MNNLKQTIKETRPTSLAVSFMDYLFPKVANKTDMTALTGYPNSWLEELFQETGVCPEWASTGPGQKHTFRTGILPF